MAAARATTTTTTTATAQHWQQAARPTPREVALMRKHYDGSGDKVIRLAMTFRVSRSTVYRWAQRLDLTQPKHEHKRWSVTEIDTLDARSKHSHMRDVAASLGRSREAVQRKAHRLDLTKCSHGYTAASLASALGCSPHTVVGWVRRGWLPNRRRHSERTARQGDYWLFSGEAVARLLCEHADAVWLHGVTPEQRLWALSVTGAL